MQGTSSWRAASQDNIRSSWQAAEEERRRQAQAANQPDPGEIAAQELEARTELRDRIKREVDDNPQLAAGALRAWLLDA